MIAQLSVLDWALLALGAALIGVAKTSLNGLGVITVVLFATVLPTAESTGALLPILIVGDLVAVRLYRRHASVRTLLRLLPGVIPGLVLGTVFLGRVDDTTLRLTIGAILLLICGLQILRRVRGGGPRRSAAAAAVHPLWAVAAGAAAGFVTMTANAAPAIMTVYLIAAGKPMLEMLGTGAWFFLAVNILKLPFSASLGLISPGSLVMDALLVPALLVGVLAGVRIVRHLRQEQYELVALGFGMLASALMIATA